MSTAGRFVEVDEWDEEYVQGAVLSAADRRLCGELAAGEARLVIEEMREGVRIRSQSWVGVVRLSGIEVRVAPKLAGDHAWLVRMLEHAGGLDPLRRIGGARSLQAEDRNLLDLFILLLCDAADELLRGGLLAGYVEREDDLPVVRGRLLVDRQVRERYGQIDRLICRHDDIETDVVENQIVAAGLRIAALRARDLALRARAHRLSALFAEACDPGRLDLRQARAELVYHRLNDHYQAAHALSWLVLEGLGVRDLLGAGTTECFAFLLEMNSLFEAFLERAVRRALGRGFAVHSQLRDRSVLRNVVTGRPYAGVIPDLVVQTRGTAGPLLVIDAKYKEYDLRKVASADIYQVFLYAFAYHAPDDPMPVGLLCYPTTRSWVAPVRIHIHNRHRSPAAEVRAVGIPIAALVEDLDAGGGPALARLADELRGLLTPAPSAGAAASLGEA